MKYADKYYLKKYKDLFKKRFTYIHRQVGYFMK